MFKKSKFKKILVVTLVIMMVLTTVAAAANSIYTKEITATYGRIKFEVDGKDVTQQIENRYNTPAFVVEDRSYVPIRAIADLMGIKVEYDDNTHTAKLTDVKSEEYEAEIKKLNDEIKKLKDEAKKEEEKKVSKTDLADLEKDLNKKYGEIDDVDFSIRLKESKDKITVNIDIDTQSSPQRNAWRKMRIRDVENMIEDILEEVYDDFDDFGISGTLYDNYQQKNLYSFKVSSSGKITIDNKDSYYYDDYRYRYDDDLLDDAEDYLYYYFNRIAKVVDISIHESDGEVYGVVEIDETKGRLSHGALEDAFQDAEDDLMDDYGSGVYFNIELDIDGKYYGRYYYDVLD